MNSMPKHYITVGAVCSAPKKIHGWSVYI